MIDNHALPCHKQGILYTWECYYKVSDMCNLEDSYEMIYIYDNGTACACCQPTVDYVVGPIKYIFNSS